MYVAFDLSTGEPFDTIVAEETYHQAVAELNDAIADGILPSGIWIVAYANQ